MRGFFIAPQKNRYYRCLCGFLACILSISLILTPSAAQAQSVLNLPAPGTMIAPSPAFTPVLLKGMTVHPEDPFQFDFIIDSGNTQFSPDQVKQESEKLVKYFLASMTVPKDDLWVNLSPYEEDRIIPDALGKTELGRDMLAQDYILKQLTASLMYPEKELGKKFWDKVYKKAEERFGTTEIPVNTFNKVWILPDAATVYEHENTVYIVDAHLKVMLDSDYQAMQYEKPASQDSNLELQSSIIKEIIIPEIEREVNQGEHFAPLRQIYHSLILAKWYKETIKNSLLSQFYVDQNKIGGIDVEDTTIKDQIYAQYMEAYKKGVFNYIKEDYDRLSSEIIPRKYFSGGFKDINIPLKRSISPIRGTGILGKGFKLIVALSAIASLSVAQPVFAQSRESRVDSNYVYHNEEEISSLIYKVFHHYEYEYNALRESLLEIGPSIIPHMVKVLKQKENEESYISSKEQGSIVSIFSQMGEPAVSDLIKALGDEQDGYSITAHIIITSLANIGPDAKEAIPALIKKFDDSKVHMRAAALSAIKKIGYNSSNLAQLKKKYPGMDNWEEISHLINVVEHFGSPPGTESSDPYYG